jgi:hypothetical protein
MRSSLYNRRPITEFCAEEHIGIRKKAFFKRNDDELRAFEPRAEQLTDMLGMGQVQGCVNLIQNIHGCRLELKQGHDEGKSNQGSILFWSICFVYFLLVVLENAPLSTTQFSQTLFPHCTKSNLNFQTIHEILTIGRLKFCEVAR